MKYHCVFECALLTLPNHAITREIISKTAQPSRHNLRIKEEHVASLYSDIKEKNITECLKILHTDVIDLAINA